MPMKKFMNDPANLTKELLEGLVGCYSDTLALVNEKIVVRKTPKSSDKVALVAFGGSGHEPAMHGFVGLGMLDACVAGDIFAAPGGEKVFEALDYVKRDAGTLLITLNHNGDRMSGSKAMRKAQKAGLKVVEIVIHDDIAQGPDTPIEDKRGLGGVIPFIKVVGAAAEEGKSLEEIVELANKFNEGIATLSVALKVATHPQNGGEIGALADDEMEIGMGQHGEGGGGISKMCTADETVEKMLPSLVKATKIASGDKALLLINGSGSTTTMEMLICYRKAKSMLEAVPGGSRQRSVLDDPLNGTTMTLDQFKQVWARAAEKIAAREKDYSALDAAAGGDGDHGEAIVAATRALAAAQGADFKSLLTDMVNHLESDVSGSTSSLYGTLFEGMADAVDAGVTELDAPGIADLFAAGLEELGFATKAKVGDKTFMDALIPAIEALKAHAAEGEQAMFAAAAAAAKAGSEATAQMQAKFGRAKNLGERSIGPIDAGSASNADIWSCFAAD